MATYNLPQGGQISDEDLDKMTPDQLRQLAQQINTAEHPSYATDIAKGAQAGAETGLMKAVTAVPTMADLALQGTSALSNELFGQKVPPGASGNKPGKIGLQTEPTQFSQGVDKFRQDVTYPYSYEGVRPAFEQQFPSSTYQAKTIPGRIAQTTMDVLPSAVGGAIMSPSRVGPALLKAGTSSLGAGIGGGLTKGTPYEPLGEIGGAALGYGAPGLIRKTVTPFPADPYRTAQVERLRNAGLPLDAAQATGSPRLRAWLGPPPAGQDKQISDIMLQQRNIGTAGNVTPLPQLIDQQERNVQNYGRYLANQVPVRVDPQGLQAMQGRANYFANSGGQGTAVQDEVNRLGQLIQNGQITGDQYWRLRQEWHASPTPEVRHMADDLDAMMNRSVQGTPAEGRWNRFNTAYADIQGLRNAAERNSPGAAQGILNPADVRSGIMKDTPLKQLATDAQSVLAPIQPAEPGQLVKALGPAVGSTAGYFLGPHILPAGATGITEPPDLIGLLLGGSMGYGAGVGAKAAQRGIARVASPYLENQLWRPGPYTTGIDPKVAAALLAGQAAPQSQLAVNPQP